MLNKICICGRFTKDPELRSTTTGTSVVSFSVAVDRDFKEQDGTRKADFINCVAWRNTAEFICNYFRRGSMAIIEGSLQTRPYEDADGKKRTATEVIVNNIYFGESKKQDAEAPNVPDELIAPMGNDDDLPF